jgi:hypothetical protein
MPRGTKTLSPISPISTTATNSSSPKSTANLVAAVAAEATERAEISATSVSRDDQWPEYDKPDDFQPKSIFEHCRRYNAEQLALFKRDAEMLAPPKKDGPFELYAIRCRDENEAFQLTCGLAGALWLLDTHEPAVGRDHCHQLHFKQLTLPFTPDSAWLLKPVEIDIWTVAVWWHPADLLGFLAILRLFFERRGQPQHGTYRIDIPGVIQSTDYLRDFTGQACRFVSHRQ